MNILMEFDGETVLYVDLEEMRESIIEAQESNRQREDLYAWQGYVKEPCPAIHGIQDNSKEEVLLY